MLMAPTLALQPPELARRSHFQGRVRMHLVEVLERSWQLGQHRRRVAKVHAAEVIASEGVDEALGHAVALRLHTGVLIGFSPNARAMRRVSSAM